MYFFYVESQSVIHFCQPELDTLNNPKKPKISGLPGVSVAGQRKWTQDLDSAGKKKNSIYLFHPENFQYPEISDR